MFNLIISCSQQMCYQYSMAIGREKVPHAHLQHRALPRSCWFFSADPTCLLPECLPLLVQAKGSSRLNSSLRCGSESCHGGACGCQWDLQLWGLLCSQTTHTPGSTESTFSVDAVSDA